MHAEDAQQMSFWITRISPWVSGGHMYAFASLPLMQTLSAATQEPHAVIFLQEFSLDFKIKS